MNWFLVAFWVLLLTNVANSAPVFGAIAAFASSALGGFLVKGLLGLAISLSSSLLGKLFQKKQTGPDPSTTLSLKVGGTNPLEFPLGPTATAGLRIFAGSWGHNNETPNEYLVDVVRLSDVPVSGLNGLWLNDQRVTIMYGEPKQPQGWPILEFRKNGTDYAWIDFYDGTQTTHNTYLAGKFGSNPEYPWLTDMVGRGVAFCVFTGRFQRDLWAGGFPTMLAEVGSIKLYDPRKDTTVGGSGAHRWGDVSTYEPSANRAVHIYNVMRGIYYGTEWVYGGQNWPAFRLPLSSWFAAMNACDLAIPLDGGGTEPQFHGGGMVQTDVVPADIIDELLRSCSGLIAEIGGIFKIRVGAPGAPVYSFTDANILVTREQGFNPFPGLHDTVNILNISYMEPVQRWAMKESPARRNAAFIVEDDNRELPAGVNLPFVNSNTTAQRIALTALNNGRRWRVHTFYLPPEAWLLEPLDVVSWTSAHNSYVNKSFEIQEMNGEPNLLQFVNVREVDPTDYNWNPATDELPYQVIPPIAVYPAPQPVLGWQALPGILYDNEGRPRRPSIEIHYTGGMADIRALRVQVRLKDETGILFDGEVLYDETHLNPSIVLQGEFLPNTDYEVRGIFLSYTGRDMLWSNQDSVPPHAEGPWLAVRTGDIKFLPGVDFDPFAGTVGFPNLDVDLQGYQDWMGANTRELINQAQAQATQTADQELSNSSTFAELRRTLGVSLGELQATFEETITTVIQPLGDEVVAIANALTTLSAGTVGGDVNTANFQMTVLTGPTGYSRIGARARQGGAGTFRDAAWFLDVPNNPALPTRFVVSADQLIVDAGGNLENPFIVDAFGLKIKNAFIRNITAASIQAGSITAVELDVTTLSAITADVGVLNAGVVQSTDGKMVIDLDNAFIEITV